MKKTLIAAIALLILLLLLPACGTEPEAVSAYPGVELTQELGDRMDAGINGPDPVVAQAWGAVLSRMHDYASLYFESSAACMRFSDVELTRLECTHRFDDWYEDRVVEAYALEFRLKPADSSLLPDTFAPYMDGDGWLSGETDHGWPWIIAENTDGQINALGYCYPGWEDLGLPRQALSMLIGRDVNDGATAEQLAVLALADVSYSIRYLDESRTFSFQLPEMYPRPEAFEIQIVGQADGNETAFLTEENAAKSWEIGGAYQFSIGDAAYSQLQFTAALPGPDGNAVVKEIDLLPYIDMSHRSKE